MTSGSIFKLCVIFLLFFVMLFAFDIQLIISLILSLILYIMFGIFIIIGDFSQPVHNQPQYVRSKNYSIILIKVLLWPVLS